MKTLKWFFTTNEDGENPAVMIVSMLIGFAIVFFVVWAAHGFPALPIAKYQ